MKKLKMFNLICTLFLSVIAIPVSAAVISVSGEFGNETDQFGNLATNTYPFPTLYGGTFSGSFEFDRLSLVSSNSFFNTFAMTSVSINIINNLGTTINTITNQSPENNYIRAALNGSYIYMVFGYSSGLVNGLEDLRLRFDGRFLAGTGFGPTVSEINASTFNTSPNSSFIETDGSTSSLFWDLEVVSASISGVVVPEPAPVATPAIFWLFAFSLIGISTMRMTRE